MTGTKMTFGPERRNWPHDPPLGDCPECGGDCSPEECGRHPAGCMYGGPTEATAYWLIAAGCDRYHGETQGTAPDKEQDDA